MEVLSIRERVRSAEVQFRWVDADQQLADGVSKPLAYNDLVTAFQREKLCIEFDDQFTSAKEKRAQRASAKGSMTPETFEPTTQTHQEKNFDRC